MALSESLEEELGGGGFLRTVNLNRDFLLPCGQINYIYTTDVWTNDCFVWRLLVHLTFMK